jgi:hypothetical protein
MKLVDPSSSRLPSIQSLAKYHNCPQKARVSAHFMQASRNKTASLKNSPTLGNARNHRSTLAGTDYNSRNLLPESF